MSAFWKVLAMGVTAAAAVVVAKEVIERNERGEDCSPMAVVKGIGRKIGVMCGCKDCCCDDFDEDDFFDDFDEFELDDDNCITFDTSDMEGDELTADGYVVEFNAETDPEIVVEPAFSEEAEAEEEIAEEASADDDGADEKTSK